MTMFSDLYAALWTKCFGLDQYAKRHDSPGQMSLFGGEHDVSKEPRDARGEWTTGGGKSPEPDVVPAADVATLRQDETKPALEEEPMSTQFTVTLAKEPSEKQRQFVDDVLAQASKKLDELQKLAPQSVDVVRKRHQESLSKANTNFADNVIGHYRSKDWLSEVYQVAERELRNKEEKAALMPLRQAAAAAFNAIPVRKFQK